MIASETGHVEVVDKLLVHGAGVDLQNKVQFHQLTRHCMLERMPALTNHLPV